MLVRANQQLLEVQAFGDGNCFYHAMMLDIIHDALTGVIPEDSLTAKRIKTKLLPKIANQLAVGGPHLNFANKTLSESIIALLQAVPISASRGVSQVVGIATSSIHTPSIHTDDANHAEAITAIESCNFFHLLKEVCVPALRQLTNDEFAKRDGRVLSVVKSTLKNEFFAFIKAEYGAQLQLDAAFIDAAQRHLIGGAFADIAEENKNNIYASWRAGFDAALETQAIDSGEADEYIEQVFDQWWDKNDEFACVQYTQSHIERNDTQAAAPQKIALAIGLHCNVEFVNTGTGRFLDPLDGDHVLNDAHALRIHDCRGHYNAMVGNLKLDEPTKKVGVALQKRLKLFNDNQLALKEVKEAAHNDVPALNPHEKPEQDEECIDEASSPLKEEIESFENAQPAIVDKLTASQKDILQAAKTGYVAAMKNITLFSDGTRDAQEEADLDLAIKLQNQEILDLTGRISLSK